MWKERLTAIRCFQALHHLEEVCTFVRVLGSYQPFADSAASHHSK